MAFEGFKDTFIEFPPGDESGKPLTLRQAKLPLLSHDSQPSFLIVTNEDLETSSENTILKIRKMQDQGELPLDPRIKIEGIATGGWYLTTLLARALNTKAKPYSVGIRGYNEQNQRIPKELEYGLPEGLNLIGDALIISDDIGDSCEALNIAIQDAEGHKPDQVVTAVAYLRSQTAKFVPDAVGNVISVPDWLLFQPDWMETRRNMFFEGLRFGLTFDAVLDRTEHLFHSSRLREKEIAETILGVRPEGNSYQFIYSPPPVLVG